MDEETSYLAPNIRFLRKQKQMSQRQLAAALGIKRSNIAAYETKNVEPRLTLISRMAQFFQVSLADLITRDLAHGDATQEPQRISPLAAPQADLNMESIRRLEERMLEMRKMLEGFRVFYHHRQKNIQEAVQPFANGTGNDIENFLIFIDQVITYNEQIFEFMRLNGLSQDAARQIPSKRAS